MSEIVIQERMAESEWDDNRDKLDNNILENLVKFCE